MENLIYEDNFEDEISFSNIGSIFNYIIKNYLQFLLLFLVIFIIYFVDYITNINTFIYSQQLIPAFNILQPPQITEQIKMPKQKQSRKNRNRK
jgi:hypothetical protein